MGLRSESDEHCSSSPISRADDAAADRLRRRRDPTSRGAGISMGMGDAIRKFCHIDSTFDA
jgi:hypothetical protein